MRRIDVIYLLVVFFGTVFLFPDSEGGWGFVAGVFLTVLLLRFFDALASSRGVK